jgi:hypothetical protein
MEVRETMQQLCYYLSRRNGKSPNTIKRTLFAPTSFTSAAKEFLIGKNTVV